MLAIVQALKVEMPVATWPRYFFGNAKEPQSILGRAAMSGYGDLRGHRLPEGDEEVRVWGGFGLTYLQGIVLRKKAGRWSAVRLLSALPKSSKMTWTKAYVIPKSGWPGFWNQANTLGLWTLPDDSALPQEKRQTVLDGFSYVVELQRAGRYRAYSYDNPDDQKRWPEAQTMLRIDRLLETEFPHPKL